MPKETSPRKTRDRRPNYPVESVGLAAQLLELFKTRESIRVNEAAAQIGVARSTVHRLLAMLQFHQLVSQDEESRAYVPGPGLVDIALAVLREADIRAEARPWLERLGRELDETVHLMALLPSGMVLFLDCVESTKALRMASRTGQTLPAYATAAGKATLAMLPADRAAAMLPGELEPLTEHTVASREELEREFEEVRRRGYALNINQSENGVYALAVPIRSRSGAVSGALTVSAPVARIPDGYAEKIFPFVLEAASEIGGRLP